MKTVLLTDDHPIFLTGLRQIIEDEADFEVVGEAFDGLSCIKLAENLKPDVIISDISMPEMDGYEITDWVKDNLGSTRVIILSMHSQREFVEKAKECGACAFIAKEDAGSDLIAALNTPLGEFFTSSSVGSPLSFESENIIWADYKKELQKLTEKERIVLSMIARSLTSAQIARKMKLSIRTIQTHRQNISRKLKLRGANSLLNFAMSHNSLSDSDHNIQSKTHKYMDD